MGWLKEGSWERNGWMDERIDGREIGYDVWTDEELDRACGRKLFALIFERDKEKTSRF